MLGKMHQDALPPESVDVFCYSSKMRGLIRNLVYQLVAECIELRLKPIEKEKRRRFKALRIGKQTHGLFFERRGVSVQRLENSVDFYRCISTNKVNGTMIAAKMPRAERRAIARRWVKPDPKSNCGPWLAMYPTSLS